MMARKMTYHRYDPLYIRRERRRVKLYKIYRFCVDHKDQFIDDCLATVAVIWAFALAAALILFLAV